MKRACMCARGRSRSVLLWLLYACLLAAAEYTVVVLRCEYGLSWSWSWKELPCYDVAPELQARFADDGYTVVEVPVWYWNEDIWDVDLTTFFLDQWVAENNGSQPNLILGFGSSVYNTPDQDFMAEVGIRYPQAWIVSVDCKTKYMDQSFICGEFRDDEVSYAAGYLSGLLTKSKVLGVAGSMAGTHVPRMFVSYQAGALSSCPDCTFAGSLINDYYTFEDLADSFGTWLVEEVGADVVFGPGGDVASAAIRGAAAAGSLVVGSEIDELDFLAEASWPNSSWPLLATSAARRYTDAAAFLVALFAGHSVGDFIPGVQGNVVQLGYGTGGVGLAPCHYACGEEVTDAFEKTRVLEASLAAGSLQLPEELWRGALPRPKAFLHEDDDFSPALDVSAGGPSPRSQHSFAWFSDYYSGLDRFAVFGGVGGDDEVLGDLWLYWSSSGLWMDTSSPLTEGVPPPPLAQACMAWVQDSLVIYGGRLPNGNSSAGIYRLRDHLFNFDSPHFTWFGEPDVSGGVPALDSAGCIAQDNCILVFGGLSAAAETGDLAMLCLGLGDFYWTATWTVLWAHPGSTGYHPRPRQRAGLGLVSASAVGLPGRDTALVVAGGISEGKALRDVWVFQRGNSSWTRLPDLPQGLVAPVVFESTAPELEHGITDLIVVQSTSWVPDLGMAAFFWDTGAIAWSSQAGTWSAGSRRPVDFKGLSVSETTWLFGDSGVKEQLSAGRFRFRYACRRGYEPRGVSCDACREGWTSEGAAARCKMCPAGRFAVEVGSSGCMECPAGRYSGMGFPDCVDCPSGTSTFTLLGQASCTPCSFGRFASANGSAMCENCPIGTYGDEVGLESCSPCSGLLTTRHPSSQDKSECICPEGTFLPLHDRAGGCLPCPEGMVCPLASDAAAFLGMPGPPLGLPPAVLPGFMTLRAAPFKVYECGELLHCPGGGPASCAEYRDTLAVACGRCQSGAFEVDGVGACRPCRDQWSVRLWTAAAILACVLAVVLMTLVVNKDHNTLQVNAASLIGSVGIFVSTVQALGIFSVLHVRWTHPLSAIMKLFRFANFDIKLFRLSCLFTNSPVMEYLVVQLPIIFCCPIILATLLGQRLRRQDIEILPCFVNALGTICQLAFLPCIMSCLKPFVCFPHPSGGGSMESLPSVLCFASQEHTTMVVVGVISFCVVPIPFLSLCCYGTLKYSKVMSDVHADDVLPFIRAMRFLFLKYKMGCYYYGLIYFLRGLLVCMVPVVFRGNGPLQVIGMISVLIVFLQVQQAQMPWHSRLTNCIDGLVSCILVLVLVLVAMTTGFEASDRLLGILGLIALSFVLLLSVSLVVRSLFRYFQVMPWYNFFITHHKADSAAQARLLKLLLDTHWKQQVFIDSDDLQDLDKLFNIVASHVAQVVAYLTRDTLSRPWCVGEIVTARKFGVKVLQVHTPSFTGLSKEQLESPEVVDMSSCQSGLAKFIISLAEIRETLQWLDEGEVHVTDPAMPVIVRLRELVDKLCGRRSLQLPSVKPGSVASVGPEERSDQSSYGSAFALGHRGTAKRAATTILGHDVERTPSGRDALPEKAGFIVISADLDDEEACAASAVLAMKLQIGAVHKKQASGVCSLCDHQLDDTAAVGKLVARSMATIVILSSDTLRSAHQLFVIVEGMWQRSRQKQGSSASPLVLPVSTPSFRFPLSHDLDTCLPSAMYKHPAFGLKQVRAFFNSIAVVFATHASNDMIDAQVETMLSRIPSSFDMAAAEAKECLCNSGVEFHVPNHGGTAMAGSMSLDYATGRFSAQTLDTYMTRSSAIPGDSGGDVELVASSRGPLGFSSQGVLRDGASSLPLDSPSRPASPAADELAVPTQRCIA